jgi:hypothetical protein
LKKKHIPVSEEKLGAMLFRQEETLPHFLKEVTDVLHHSYQSATSIAGPYLPFLRLLGVHE